MTNSQSPSGVCAKCGHSQTSNNSNVSDAQHQQGANGTSVPVIEPSIQPSSVDENYHQVNSSSGGSKQQNDTDATANNQAMYRSSINGVKQHAREVDLRS